MPTNMPVAVVQYQASPLNPALNLERMTRFIVDAHSHGARLIVFPELACSGYVEHADLHRLAEDVEGSTVQTLRRLSSDYGIYLAAGFVEWRDGDVFNSICFTNPIGEISIYRKRHLIFWEHFYFRRGCEPLIVQTEFGRIGFAICADMMYHDVWSQYRDKIDLAIISAAWPRRTPQTAKRLGWALEPGWSLANDIPVEVARQLGIHVLFSNQCGPCLFRVPYAGPATPAAFAGRAGIFDPSGNRLTNESEAEQAFQADIPVPKEQLQCATSSAWASSAR